MKLKHLPIICFFVLILADHAIAQTPLSFYQDSFNGGVTAAGYSPEYDAGGTGTFNVFIPAGSTIRKAWLFASRMGDAADITVTLNNLSILLDTANQVTPPFQQELYGGNSSVVAINLTDSLSDTAQYYTLTVPDENGPSDRYNDFMLYIAYSNSSLATVNTAIFMDTANMVDTMFFKNITLNYPYGSASQFGVSMFTGYVCDTLEDGDSIYLNNNYLGLIGGANPNSGDCGGPIGDFYYQNNTMYGLDNNTTQPLMQGYEAICNAGADVTNNSTSLNMEFEAQPSGDNPNVSNNIWGVIFAYGNTGAGINDVTIKNDVQIYPNPFTDNLILNISQTTIGVKDWTMQITDVMGRVVYTALSLNYRNTINLHDLSNGMYFVKVSNEQGSQEFPVVKQ